jgi:hypothetical protein
MLIRRVSVADPERTQRVLWCMRPTGDSQIPPQADDPQKSYAVLSMRESG